MEEICGLDVGVGRIRIRKTVFSCSVVEFGRGGREKEARSVVKERRGEG